MLRMTKKDYAAYSCMRSELKKLVLSHLRIKGMKQEDINEIRPAIVIWVAAKAHDIYIKEGKSTQKTEVLLPVVAEIVANLEANKMPNMRIHKFF